MIVGGSVSFGDSCQTKCVVSQLVGGQLPGSCGCATNRRPQNVPKQGSTFSLPQNRHKPRGVPFGGHQPPLGLSLFGGSKKVEPCSTGVRISPALAGPPGRSSKLPTSATSAEVCSDAQPVKAMTSPSGPVGRRRGGRWAHSVHLLYIFSINKTRSGGFKRNLSLLDIYVFSPRGWE